MKTDRFLAACTVSVGGQVSGDVKHSLASVEVLSEKLGLSERVSFKEWLARLAASEGQ